MELAINILNNSLRKNKKTLKRYKLDGNNVAYNNILKDVLTLEKAIKILKAE